MLAPRLGDLPPPVLVATTANAAPRGRPRRPSAKDDLSAWLAWADGLHRQTIDMGLERVVAVKNALGLAPTVPVITVAGTNGKGSTCAMLGSILQAGGLRVGVYTSPHLLRYHERVRIDGVPVPDALLCAGFAQVEAGRGDVPLTPFEFGTLAAMSVLCEAGLDAIVLEVGLGGRLDAVNAFDADCAVITSIGIDHVEYLGPTRESIGREKAGVMRAGRPVVSADPEPPATIAEEAERIGARLIQSGRDYRVRSEGPGDARRHWIARPGHRPIELPPPALAGEVQWHNAAACVMALDALADRLPLAPEAIRTGLAHARLAGRFQRWRRDAASPEIVLDVAHNAHAATRLADTLAREPLGSAHGRTFAVFSMLRDKDIEDSARALTASFDSWFVAGIDDRRGSTAAELASALDRAGVQGVVQLAGSVPEALRRALAKAGRDDRIVVFGSFLAVAAGLRELGLDR
ncbi:MAG TPA: bifunctional tetrahydrofolate synthase/dihydrofolate synthase [Methylibium sp.]|uniref:bifunctional tetrahydrofolate synthase/dihydrofolate synthase n=1 Tax=Methylibium sp. TaxID=2067992 RepID=UPI002DB825CB|nr:bifunctional tetrahydrofolate synthase/dihydrofolate synthase [Methylibium sp.]HEU4459281.1 bifunctional tetrahydrofolate synthase/dihydrofolate synthase [Methylibium sp.]